MLAIKFVIKSWQVLTRIFFHNLKKSSLVKTKQKQTWLNIIEVKSSYSFQSTVNKLRPTENGDFQYLKTFSGSLHLFIFIYLQWVLLSITLEQCTIIVMIVNAKLLKTQYAKKSNCHLEILIKLNYACSFHVS